MVKNSLLVKNLAQNTAISVKFDVKYLSQLNLLFEVNKCFCFGYLCTVVKILNY